VSVAQASVAAPYPRLHIVAMGMHADRRSVTPHDRFTVTVNVVVSQKRDRLDELVLGNFDDCTIVGDERRHTTLPNGDTQFLEVLTLEAGAPGTATISPAHLDAIDPRVGHPLRYSTDPVSVRVLPAAPIDSTYASVTAAFGRSIRWVLVTGGAIAFALFGLGFVLRRRRMRPQAPPVVAPAPAVPLPAPPNALALAFEAFARARDERTLLALRAQLFAEAGVPAGATLSDALARAGLRRSLRIALVEAEAAAFGPGAARITAGDALVAAVEAYLVPGGDAR
jgi:hypothetical protein